MCPFSGRKCIHIHKPISIFYKSNFLVKNININPSWCSAHWVKENPVSCSFVLRNKGEVWSERALQLPLFRNILLTCWDVYLKESQQHPFFSIWTFYLLYQNTLVSKLLSNTLLCFPKPRSFNWQGTTSQVLIFTEKEKGI